MSLEQWAIDYDFGWEVTDLITMCTVSMDHSTVLKSQNTDALKHLLVRVPLI